MGPLTFCRPKTFLMRIFWGELKVQLRQGKQNKNYCLCFLYKIEESFGIDATLVYKGHPARPKNQFL